MTKEDNFTSTVDGAAGYAKAHAEYYDDGRPTNAELMRDEYYSEEEHDDIPECNCSDPGCPCGGIKIGGL